jgi:hypothetical protein
MNVDMYAYLVELDVLDADDAPYVLINAAEARHAIDDRSLPIVRLLLSTGEFDPDAVPGR